MALDLWIADGTLSLPFSCEGTINSNPNATIVGKTLIINDSEGDGSPPVHIDCDNLCEDAPYRTILVIKSTDHPMRLNIGGVWGPWCSSPGVYPETILGGDGNYIRLEYDPYTQAEILLVLVQPGD